jgi:hypothetical protein
VAADVRGGVGEDADDVGAAFDLAGHTVAPDQAGRDAYMTTTSLRNVPSDSTGNVLALSSSQRLVVHRAANTS